LYKLGFEQFTLFILSKLFMKKRKLFRARLYKYSLFKNWTYSL